MSTTPACWPLIGIGSITCRMRREHCPALSSALDGIVPAAAIRDRHAGATRGLAALKLEVLP